MKDVKRFYIYAWRHWPMSHHWPYLRQLAPLVDDTWAEKVLTDCRNGIGHLGLNNFRECPHKPVAASVSRKKEDTWINTLLSSQNFEYLDHFSTESSLLLFSEIISLFNYRNAAYKLLTRRKLNRAPKQVRRLCNKYPCNCTDFTGPKLYCHDITAVTIDSQIVKPKPSNRSMNDWYQEYRPRLCLNFNKLFSGICRLHKFYELWATLWVILLTKSRIKHHHCHPVADVTVVILLHLIVYAFISGLFLLQCWFYLMSMRYDMVF